MHNFIFYFAGIVHKIIFYLIARKYPQTLFNVSGYLSYKILTKLSYCSVLLISKLFLVPYV